MSLFSFSQTFLVCSLSAIPVFKSSCLLIWIVPPISLKPSSLLLSFMPSSSSVIRKILILILAIHLLATALLCSNTAITVSLSSSIRHWSLLPFVFILFIRVILFYAFSYKITFLLYRLYLYLFCLASKLVLNLTLGHYGWKFKWRNSSPSKQLQGKERKNKN